MKLFRNYILIILALIIVVFLLQKVNIIPGINDIFSPKEVLIENTPILIREIKELAQMITVTAYDEVVVDSAKASALDLVKTITGFSVTPLSPPYDRLVIVAKGRVMAGTDLNLLDENNIMVTVDSVSVRLPGARILDIVINPSDFSTFTETGRWTNEEVTLVKLKARKKMEMRAMQNNILFLAENRSKLLMENFLKSTGFKKVHIFN
jgi:hypothetical protein